MTRENYIFLGENLKMLIYIFFTFAQKMYQHWFGKLSSAHNYPKLWCGAFPCMWRWLTLLNMTLMGYSGYRVFSSAGAICKSIQRAICMLTSHVDSATRVMKGIVNIMPRRFNNKQTSTFLLLVDIMVAGLFVTITEATKTHITMTS